MSYELSFSTLRFRQLSYSVSYNCTQRKLGIKYLKGNVVGVYLFWFFLGGGGLGGGYCGFFVIPFFGGGVTNELFNFLRDRRPTTVLKL